MSILIDGYVSDVLDYSSTNDIKHRESITKLNSTELRHTKKYLLCIKDNKHISFYSKNISGFGSICGSIGNNVFLVSGYMHGNVLKEAFQFEGTMHVYTTGKSLGYDIVEGKISYTYNIMDVKSIFTNKVTSVSVECNVQDSNVQSVSISGVPVIDTDESEYIFPYDMPSRYHVKYPLHIGDLKKYLHNVFPFVLAILTKED